ncbi:nucleoid occlusion factor SlmA [Xylophilus sp. Kf1]|nr:nucleoid occlusion factor SlmA [Xylophilus sp. Kf1]
MSEAALNSIEEPQSADAPAAGTRKRPKPGERRVQILRALAEMLEKPGAERVTTAALAARLDVSEAALYRHFASKAQMLEGLIEFIEQSVFSLVEQMGERREVGNTQAGQLVGMLLQFAEKNPGMTRVMVGDALVFENERLQQRMNLFFDKFEQALLKALGDGSGAADAAVSASVLCAFSVGRLQRFARSGFRRLPSEHLEASLATML